MRVWRFQQISDEENKTIDGTDQSFNALQEEKNDKDNSQTESETKKEQMISQGSESEQEAQEGHRHGRMGTECTLRHIRW